MKRLIFLLAFVLSGSSLPTLKYRALDNSGVPMSGAKLYFYTHGTTTAKATYSDAALSAANANPVVADSHGWFGEIYMATNDLYKVTLKSALGITIWTIDDVAAVQLGDSSLAARILQIASSPMDYGAAGDGSTDDSVAVQAAITGASGTVDLVGKTYHVGTGLTLKSNLTIKNGTLDFTASADDNYLSATGTVGSAVLLGGTATAGDVSIELASVAGLAVGDLLWLTSHDVYGTATGTDGEILRITFIDGVDVYLAAPLNGTYPSAGVSCAADACVQEITSKHDITLDNVTVAANSAATGSGVLFSCTYCDRVTLRGTSFTGIKTTGLSAVTSTLINIQAARFSGTYDVATADGVQLVDGTSNVMVSSSVFSSLHRGINFGYDGASRKGVVRNITISSSTFESCSQASIRAGILSQHLSVSGCLIRSVNPADGMNLVSVNDVRVASTTFVGGDYGIDDTTVTHMFLNSNYFTGQTTGAVRGSTSAALIVAGSSGNQIGVSATGYGSGSGVNATGGVTGAGLTAVGGATSGNGVTATATNGNGNGVAGTGNGSGAGVLGTASATGTGVTGTSVGAGAAVTGVNTGSGFGVLGDTTGGSGIAVRGTTDSAALPAVQGVTTGAGGAIIGSAENSDSWAIKAMSDPTSPVRSSIFMLPQDANPTTNTAGSIYTTKFSTTAIGLLRAYAMGVWSKVVHQVSSAIADVTLTVGSPTATLFTVPASTLKAGSVISVEVLAYVSTDAGGVNDAFVLFVDLDDGATTQTIAFTPSIRPTLNEPMILRGSCTARADPAGNVQTRCGGTGVRTEASGGTKANIEASGTMATTSATSVRVTMYNGGTTDAVTITSAHVTVN